MKSYPHTLVDIEKFNARVNRGDGSGCWMWTGATFDERGYGVFTLKRKAIRAHRFAWYVENRQEMPNDMVVMHLCDNPSCVRPSHLRLASTIDNVHDRDAKGRTARGERSGSKLTSEQVQRILFDKREQREIARDYGVCKSTIGYIKRKESWKHV